MSIWKTKKENPIIEKEGLYLTFSKDMGTRLLYFQKNKKLYLMCIDEYCLLDDLLNQQTEINRLREALENMTKSFDNLKAYYPQTHLFVEDCKRRIKQALNGESEEK